MKSPISVLRGCVLLLVEIGPILCCSGCGGRKEGAKSPTSVLLVLRGCVLLLVES